MSTKSATSTDQPDKRSATNLDAAIERVRAASRGIGREIFATRALRAVVRLATEMDERSLLAAIGGSSDYEVLLLILEDPNSLRLLADDPLVPARLRGLRQSQQLLRAEGGTVPAAVAAELLGISRQAVHKRRRAGRLIGLSTGRRGYAYPYWQFNPEGDILAGLESVLAELSDHDPWMQVAFMLRPSSLLDDESPLSMLRRGEIEATRRAARMYGVQGAA